MRTENRRSTEITEIIGDVAKGIDCIIAVHDEYGKIDHIPCPPINYVFGNAPYIHARLKELGESERGERMKYPLIALKVPITEKRGNGDYFAKVKAEILIAFPSVMEWSNEQRRVTSFENVLRPIYRAFMEGLEKDGRFNLPYNHKIPHEYSENYSYGRFGAYTPNGDKLPDPIDAINITNLELTIKNIKCR